MSRFDCAEPCFMKSLLIFLQDGVVLEISLGVSLELFPLYAIERDSIFQLLWSLAYFIHIL